MFKIIRSEIFFFIVVIIFLLSTFQPGLDSKIFADSILFREFFYFETYKTSIYDYNWGRDLQSWWLYGQDLKFFRPLSQLLLSLDFLFYPSNPLINNILGVAWYILLVFTMYVFYLQIGLSRKISRLSILLQSVHHYNVTLALWSGARHVLIASVFAIWTLIFFEKSLSAIKKPNWVIFYFLFFIGIFTSEYYFFCIPYLLLRLFQSKSASSKLATPLVFVSITTLLWSCILYNYIQLNYFYINPFLSPIKYLTQLSTTVPVNILSLFYPQVFIIRLFNLWQLEYLTFIKFIMIFIIFLILYNIKKIINFKYKIVDNKLILPSIFNFIFASFLLNQDRMLAAFMFTASPLVASTLINFSKTLNKYISTAILIIFVLTLILIRQKLVIGYNTYTKNITRQIENFEINSKDTDKNVFILNGNFRVAFFSHIRKWQQLTVPNYLMFLNYSQENGSITKIVRTSEHTMVIETNQGIFNNENKTDLFEKLNYFYEPNKFEIRTLNYTNGIPKDIEIKFFEKFNRSLFYCYNSMLGFVQIKPLKINETTHCVAN